MTNSIFDFLGSLAAIATILTSIVCFLRYSFRQIRNKLKTTSNLAGAIGMIIWLSILLVFLLIKPGAITRIDVISIALLTCLLFVIMMKLSLDLNVLNQERTTRKKHDLFSIGEDE